MNNLFIRILLLIIGAGLLILTLFLFIFANITIGIVATGVLGAMLLLWANFYDKVNKFFKTKSGKILKLFLITIIICEFALTSFVAIYGQNDTVTYNEDVVIVLGSGVKGNQPGAPLKLRLDKALIYHEKNPDAYIVVTGGMGNGERLSEAEVMKNYLVINGADEDKILMETESTSTRENMRFSKTILDEVLKGDYSINVITNDFHMYRSLYLAKDEGFKQVHSMHTGLKWYNILPCYIRESLAILKTWIIG